MFWILQVSQPEEQQRMQKLFTNRAKTRRKILALARLEKRQGTGAHKKEIDPKPPSLMVGLAKKAETIGKLTTQAIGRIPLIGIVLAIPFSIATGIIKVLWITFDWRARRELRREEETHFKQEKSLKKAAGVKEPQTRLHEGGVFDEIRKLLSKPIMLFDYPILNEQLSFIVRVFGIAALIVGFILMVGATIAIIQTIPGATLILDAAL